MRVRLVKTSDAGFKPLLKKILGRRGNRESEVERRVTEIVGAVQKHGDRALLKYTEMFDRIRLTPATWAAASMIAPSLPIGEVMMISLTPATLAGITFIKTVEG